MNKWYSVEEDELWPEQTLLELPVGHEPTQWDVELSDEFVQRYREAHHRFLQARGILIDQQQMQQEKWLREHGRREL